MEIKISPISINRCWQGKRFKTKAYTAWREEMGWLIKRPAKPIKAKYIQVEFHVKNFSMMDIDNMVKPFLDALKECGVIEDDRFIEEMHMKKIKAKTEEKIIFKLK